MNLIDTVTVYPLPLVVLRAYLLSRTEITSLCGTRVSDTMPAATSSPRWPAIRLDDTSTGTKTRHRSRRTLFQADCWAATRGDAERLAARVVAVLEAVRQYETSDAVLYHATDLVAAWRPDTSLNPLQPRSVVTGHIYTRPT